MPKGSFVYTSHPFGIEPCEGHIAGRSRTDKDDLLYQDTEIPTKTLRYNPRKRNFACYVVIAATMAIALAVLIPWPVVTGNARHQPRTTATVASPQGSSRNCEGGPEKATAAGCVFDVMTARWTPPECFNAELSKNASASIKHPIFYRWPNFTDPLSDTEDPWVLQNYDEGWTYTDYHVVHCRYVLQLAAEAAGRWAHGETNFLLNSLSADPYHTDHCMWVLKSQEENKHRPSASYDPAKTGVACISVKDRY